MKKRSRVQPAVLSLLLTVLPGCVWWPKPSAPPLTGNWTNSIGTVWMIKPDGTFDADFTRNGERDVWGKYKVRGDTVTLVATGGWRMNTCRGEGIYKFRRNGDQLRFTLVSDTCKLRKENVLLPWRLKK